MVSGQNPHFQDQTISAINQGFLNYSALHCHLHNKVLRMCLYVLYCDLHKLGSNGPLTILHNHMACQTNMSRLKSSPCAITTLHFDPLCHNAFVHLAASTVFVLSGPSLRNIQDALQTQNSKLHFGGAFFHSVHHNVLSNIL